MSADPRPRGPEKSAAGAGTTLRHRVGKSPFHLLRGEEDGDDHDDGLAKETALEEHGRRLEVEGEVTSTPLRPGGRRASLQYGAVKVRRRSLLVSVSRGSQQPRSGAQQQSADPGAPRGRRTSLQYGSSARQAQSAADERSRPQSATTTAASSAPDDDEAAVESHEPAGAPVERSAFDEAQELANLVQRLSPKRFAEESTELTHTQRMTRAWRRELARGREDDEVLRLYERILDGVLPSLLCDRVRAQRSRFALPQRVSSFVRQCRSRLAVSWQVTGGLLLTFASENSALVAYLAMSSTALAIFA